MVAVRKDLKPDFRVEVLASPARTRRRRAGRLVGCRLSLPFGRRGIGRIRPLCPILRRRLRLALITDY